MQGSHSDVNTLVGTPLLKLILQYHPSLADTASAVELSSQPILQTKHTALAVSSGQMGHLNNKNRKSAIVQYVFQAGKNAPKCLLLTDSNFSESNGLNCINFI